MKPIEGISSSSSMKSYFAIDQDDNVSVCVLDDLGTRQCLSQLVCAHPQHKLPLHVEPGTVTIHPVIRSACRLRVAPAFQHVNAMPSCMTSCRDFWNSQNGMTSQWPRL